MSSGQVIIVCALYPEAAAVIEALELSPGPSFGKMRLFGCGSPTPLCISGIGAFASAAAVALARAQLPASSHPSFLNLGISGHQNLARGEAWLAHQVHSDHPQRSALHPLFAKRPALPTDILHTRNEVERSFDRPGGYDMEGYGFLQAALSFASAEQCALLKVVSDGPAEHEGERNFKIDAKTARRLIRDRLEPIFAQIQDLRGYSAERNERDEDPPHFRDLVERARFSETQIHRLRKLLQRWTARFPGQVIDPEQFGPSPEQGLDKLEKQLSEHQGFQRS